MVFFSLFVCLFVVVVVVVAVCGGEGVLFSYADVLVFCVSLLVCFGVVDWLVGGFVGGWVSGLDGWMIGRLVD